MQMCDIITIPNVNHFSDSYIRHAHGQYQQ